MLARQFCRRVNERSSRYMATLVATEEFALTPPVANFPRPAAIVKQSTNIDGMTIVTRETSSPMTTMKFAIRGGSRAESVSEKGAAHMLGITAFAGTARISGLRMVRDLEQSGTSFSAMSDREKVVLTIVSPTNTLDFAVIRVAESIQCPPGAAYVINDSKPTGQIAYDALKTNPKMQLTEMLHEAAYGEDTPMGSSIYAYNLNKLSSDDVMEFRSHNYNSNNLTITVDGGVSHEKVLAIVDKCFVQFTGGASAPARPVPASPYQGGDVKLRTDLDGMTYLAIAFPVPAGLAGKPYQVLHNMVSSKISAMNKTGLAPFFTNYSTGGLFGFYATGSAYEATALLTAAVSELKIIASGSGDIEASKKKVHLNNLLAMTEEAAAETLLNAAMCGASAAELADTSSVTAQEVKAAAVASLKSVPSYAVLGTTSGTLSFTAICKLVSI